MNQKKSATERTFQGILISLVNQILSTNSNIGFKNVTQEENVGVGENKFSDGILYSQKDSNKKVFIELKDTNWDATDEVLVLDAMRKANNNGIEYFVTGTPRQLVIFKTFIPNTGILDRKLKIYNLSNVKNNDETKSEVYSKEVFNKLVIFLKELSDLVHEIKEISWDSIDKFFINKLSSYILEASADMFEVMHDKINKDDKLKSKLQEYLNNQDIFKIGLNFTSTDIYNLCQLSNYLLYLKIIFYSYLQREVPKLKLKKLEIPEDIRNLNSTLRKRFDEVLKHDYEMIFCESVLDEFEFKSQYLPVFKKNVKELGNLNFKDLNCDIIGSIYNTLIDNQEQHDRGQHFTNTNEVDIVNAFCINEKTETILDSGCGAGTFLVRAYLLLKYYHPEKDHKELLERLWGIEIALFPAFLASMNLSLLKVSEIDNYPLIIKSDFSEVKSKSKFKRILPEIDHIVEVKKLDNKNYEVKIPEFDVCIGNPPYQRQELIENKEKWNNLAANEFSITKINQQSDLYLYYLIHTSAFLKEGGRLGYVISSSWLDTIFGSDLQKFILDHFKIIAIIDNQKKRSFETASVNTVILILEKSNDKKQRESNNVKFVRVYKDYDKIIGQNQIEQRIIIIKEFVNVIINCKTFTKSDQYFIFAKNQKILEKESTYNGKYENGNWGAKYLRSPEIYNKIISKASEKLLPISNIAEVKYGIKTGANEFFYMIDDTQKVFDMLEDEYELQFGIKREKHKINWKEFGWYFSEMNNRHYTLERRFFKPLFKTQREADKLEIKISKLKYQVLICYETKKYLKQFKLKLLQYIEDGEKLNYHKRPTCNQRISEERKIEWFNLSGNLFIGDFIFPSKIGEYFRLIDNRESQIYCDKVNYNVRIKKELSYLSDIIFLILNSTMFRFFLDLFSRQLTGSQTLSDVDVNVLEKTLIIDPKLLERHKPRLDKLLKQFKLREQEKIYEELKKNDRKEIDLIILKELGLNEDDLNELYFESGNYVKERSIKSNSVNQTKKKVKLSYDETLKLLKSRFPEIRKLDDLISDMKCKIITIPGQKGKYPVELINENINIFNSYKIYFKGVNKQIILLLENIEQVKLIYFLNEKLEFKDCRLKIPIINSDSELVLNLLKYDFQNYFGQFQSFLKSIRNKSNPLSLYRDLIHQI